MQPLSPSQALSDALSAGGNTLVCHNPDEEMGFAGKKNHELIPDIRLYTCRSVLTTTDHPHDGRTVIVPEDCRDTVRQTAVALRETVGLERRLHPDAVVGVPFRKHDSLFSAIDASRSRLQGVVRDAHSVSYTMFSPQVDRFRKHQPHLAVPGSLTVSETFNNKALSAIVCKEIGIPMPQTRSVFTPDDVRTSYRALKRTCGLPLLLKGGRSASGFAMRLVKSDEEFEAALLELLPYVQPQVYPVKGMTPRASVGLVLQEYLQNVEGSPGAAVLVGSKPGAHTFVGVSDQMLDAQHHHQGNIHPVGPYYTPDVHAQVIDALTKAADEACLRGGSGMMLCADFVVQHGKVSLVEFNMRLSAQYGELALSHDLFGTTAPKDRAYFVGNTMRTTPDVLGTFSALQDRGLLYNTRTRTGCVPLNLTIPGQMQSVVFAESPSRLQEMVTEVGGR